MQNDVIGRGAVLGAEWRNFRKLQNNVLLCRP